jgi:hypothetical protein
MKLESIRKRLGRKRIKQEAVNYKGGKCIRCGYNKCLAALHFHHRNRNEKIYEMNMSQRTSLKSIKAELDKCDLVCANCHAEIEQEYYDVVAQR